MIDLSIDLSYLSRYFNVLPIATGATPVPASGMENEDESITIKTEDGQITVNREILQKLLQEPEKMAKILKLTEPKNRYLIIRELNPEDLAKLLPYLPSEQLALGLQYFTIDGIQELMTALPKEELVNLLLINFTMKDVIPFMEENEMNNFFKNPNLDKTDVLDYFKSLDPSKIQKIMVNQFGADFNNKSQKECVDYIETMEDDDYKRFLQGMELPEKGDVIAGLCQINPDYYLEFENKTLTSPMINNLEKNDIIQTMSSLDPEFLIPMIEELPDNLIQIVATQIDPTEFSKIISNEFPELIMEMLAG